MSAIVLDGPPQEQWRPVVDWEGLYEVSNLGRVKRLGRWSRARDGGRRWTSEKIRKFKRRGIRFCGNGRVEVIHNVARVVLLAWVGPPPLNKPFARHLDDNHQNNQLTNLAWGSRQDNSDDAVRNGRTRRGRKFPEEGMKRRGKRLTKQHRHKIGIASKLAWARRKRGVL